MTGLCLESSNGEYTFTFDGDTPEIGHSYILDSAVTGTGAQNRTFHALTLEYFSSGQHSYNAGSYADFKNQIKKSLGAGFESFIYVEMIYNKPIIKDCKKYDDIPENVRNDPELRSLARGRLKSWSSYTKKQRKTTIDNVISEMLQCGINTNKFQEIMKGIQSES